MNGDARDRATRGTLAPSGPYAVVQYVALAGAAAALMAQIRLAGRLSVGSALFAPWALLPFVVAYIGMRSRPDSGLRALGLGLASVFGLVPYLDLALASRLSSTAGLAFLFVPLWQVLGCGVILLLTSRR